MPAAATSSVVVTAPEGPDPARPAAPTVRTVGPGSIPVRWLAAAALAGATVAALTLGVPHWPDAARATLGIFALAIVAWTVLGLDDTPVALCALLALATLGLVPADDLFAGLGSSLVWLMIGAFVLAAALTHSGLALRCAQRAVAGAATVQALLWRLTWVVAATAFVVPSTSGRAALLLPLFLALARALADERLTRALALLFATVILLSAGAALPAAGAHLVAVEFLRGLGAPAPDYLQWAALAAPVSAAACAVATLLIGHLFLDRAERLRPVALPAAPTQPMTPGQKAVAAVVALTIVGWAGGSALGIDPALVALAGALAATCRPLTGLTLKSALKSVEWNLVVFLAATMALGEALLHSGAARLLAEALLATVPLQGLGRTAVLALAGAVALASHLLITSRTARAVVLLPTVVLPLSAFGVDPVALVMLVTLASGYCQTFMVSAKPVAMFAATDLPTYGHADLVRLSAALALPVAALFVGTAWFVWPLQGLAH
jgi:solute carrier family 13 (sodium-dependent dicarboxylate transporter), member 2/3/5